jgi:hypothetical protein
MKSPEDDGLDDGFAQSWKRWAAQPPRRSPVEAAAEVALRIRLRRGRRRSSWMLAAAAAILLAAVGTTVLWRHSGTVPSAPTVTEQEILAPGKGEVLMWIDEQTPLYMTFQAPEEEQGRGGKQ